MIVEPSFLSTSFFCLKQISFSPLTIFAPETKENKWIFLMSDVLMHFFSYEKFVNFFFIAALVEETF